jgi:23S rRNA (guanosine2251-2'-O)-methyltransferase
LASIQITCLLLHYIKELFQKHPNSFCLGGANIPSLIFRKQENFYFFLFISKYPIKSRVSGVKLFSRHPFFLLPIRKNNRYCHPFRSIFATMNDTNQNKRKISHQKLYGVHAVSEALASGKEIERVFLKRGDNPRIKDLQRILSERSIPFVFVPEAKLNREAGEKHQGVMAICALIEYGVIEEVIATVFERGENPLILILDGITDVRNLGGIARTAECMGVHAIVVPESGSAQINGETVKISSGALHNIPMCRTKSIPHTIEFMQNAGITIVGASEKAETCLHEFDFCKPIAIVMGSEDHGLSNAVIRKVAHLLRIPMAGVTSSLNVSVACGMLLYECKRQRIFGC